MINKSDAALSAEGLRELSSYLVGLSLRALAVDESGLSLPLLRTLEVVGELGSTKARVLAEQTGVHPSTMSRICDRLLADGFITCEPNPESRREVLVAITPSGSAVVQRVSDRRLAAWTQILTHVPSQSRPGVDDAVGLLTSAAARCHTENAARR